MTNQDIGKRFRKWRLDKDMTQKAIADKLELLPNYICLVETKGMGFSQKSLQILITKLDIDINWLLTGKKKSGNY